MAMWEAVDRLIYFFNGRHMRLTDAHGELLPGIVA
jgi:hypothetical protein